MSALLILASSAGLTVAMHYCGHSLQDVGLFGETKPCCAGMEMPSGCCHEEKIEIKAADFSLSSPVLNAGFVPVLLIEFAFPILDFTSHYRGTAAGVPTHFVDAQPPGPPDILLLVQSFLI